MLLMQRDSSSLSNLAKEALLFRTFVFIFIFNLPGKRLRLSYPQDKGTQSLCAVGAHETLCGSVFLWVSWE